MMSSLMIFDHLWPGLSGPMQENEVPTVSVLGGSGPAAGAKASKANAQRPSLRLQNLQTLSRAVESRLLSSSPCLRRRA